MNFLKYSSFLLTLILDAALSPYVFAGIPADTTLRGFLGFSSYSVGHKMPFIMFGAVGLLNKPNRFGGLIVCTLAIQVAMWAYQDIDGPLPISFPLFSSMFFLMYSLSIAVADRKNQ